MSDDYFGNYYIPPPEAPAPSYGSYDYAAEGMPLQEMAQYGEVPVAADHWSGLSNVGDPGVPYGPAPAAEGNWFQQLYSQFLGPNTAFGGKQGMFPESGPQGQGWASPIASLLSGVYGNYLANKQRQQARSAISGSAPWTASGGTAMAGDQLKRVIGDDFTGDAGFQAAQQSAARASSQQPGGFAASAAAQAALKYQNERIQTLGAPAGVGFSPASGYQIAVGGTGAANDLASRSLATIGYGMAGGNAGTSMPPWLQQYLIQNGMAGGKP